jgi:Flp pilus assembly protein TadG
VRRLLRSGDASASREAGIVAVYVAILTPVLLIVAAFAVDVSRWYVELQRLQKTVDAAALAAAPFMPDDLGGSSRAVAAARALVVSNGYDPATMDVRPGPRRTAVEVQLSSTVQNGLATAIAIDETTLTRSATGEFTGPAPLGSPCNVHGNEPFSGSEPSQLPSPPPDNCSSHPKFWSTVVGPEVHKTQGDQFSPRKCGGGESGCASSGGGAANLDFTAAGGNGQNGYVVTVSVREPLSGPLTIELYDPAYVDTGSECTQLPDWSGRTNTPNDYTTNARERYRNNAAPLSDDRPSYCTGDNDNAGLRFGSSEVPTITSFGLLSPTDTLNPFSPSVNASNQVPGCAVQYPGFSKTGSGNNAWESLPAGLAPGSTAVQQLSRNGGQLTRLFHQWVPLCTVANPVVGDYYLRVRTNVPWGTPTGVYTQVGDNPSVLGNGANRFSIRAVPGSTSDRAKVSVSPFERMPIFANANESDPTFNLIRVIPESRGSNIIFSFFDVGDAAGGSGATLSVRPPVEAKLGATDEGVGGAGFVNATDCTRDRGFTTGPSPTCSISGIRNSAGWNGQFQEMTIPVPNDYWCNADDPFGCWWRLTTEFVGTSSVTDQTTWTAVLDGDPVRLID